MRWRFFIDEPTLLIWLIPMIFVAIGINIIDSTIPKILLSLVGISIIAFGLSETWITYNMRIDFQERMTELYGDSDDHINGGN